ncbi:hypothetical protein LCGC14_0484090 [marine sediment metagenome]|uniref:Uncharacterized protein n=1 Tax=marine sediment metagenome TaxID=412755 RepID=A0A0F9VHF7_9ZZZZ
MNDARRHGGYNGLKLTGRFKIIVRDKNGKVLETRTGKNLVTDDAEELVAKLLDINGAETAPNYIAFGTGTNGAQKSDTQLGTEISSSRVEVTSTVQTNNTLQLLWPTLTWAAGSQTFTELGIFNASVAGVLFSRMLTQPLSITNGVELDISWTLTISGVD